MPIPRSKRASRPRRDRGVLVDRHVLALAAGALHAVACIVHFLLRVLAAAGLVRGLRETAETAGRSIHRTERAAGIAAVAGGYVELALRALDVALCLREGEATVRRRSKTTGCTRRRAGLPRLRGL